MPHGPSRVVALVVCQDGAPFLRATLEAVVRQTRQVDDLLLVDTGSRDDSVDVARQLLGPASVLAVRGPFGRAVTAALALPRVSAAEWLWLLHDDSAPDPGALSALLGEAALSSRAKILGPKLVGWHDAGRILEVGWSADRSGRPRALVDADELDQGQHDQVRDVFSVSTAGMLAEREALTAAGGFDARMPAFGDDVDLCWRVHLLGGRVLIVPSARVRHFMAATVGSRRPKPVARPRFLRERHALATLVKTTGGLRLPFVLALALGSLLVRALALLATGRPGEAAQVVSAAAWNAIELPETLRQRRHVQRSRLVRDAELRGLRTPFTERMAAGWHQLVLALLGGGAGGGVEPGRGRLGGLAARRLATGRPALLATGGLLVLAALSLRGILGAAHLAGGAAAPFPAGASDLWRAFGAAFSPAGLGSSAPRSPELALHAMVATLALGKGPVAQKLELLAALPLLAACCLRALRVLEVTPVARVVAALLYATSPLALAALAQGRIGTLGFLAVAPLALAQIVLALRPQQAREPWRPALRFALLGALATAFQHAALPTLVGAALIGFVVAAARAGGQRAAVGRRALWLLGGVILAGLLLFPWSAAGWSGGIQLPEARSSYLGLLALRPAGPGTPMPLLCLVYPLLAVVALWPGGRRLPAAASLVAGLVVAAAAAAWGSSQARPALGWPPALLVPGAVAWAGAAALAVDRLWSLRFRRATGAGDHPAEQEPRRAGPPADGAATTAAAPGLQRVAAAVVTVVVGLGGLGIAGHLLRGSWSPLRAVGGAALPATVSASTGRVLWLSGRADGGVDYALTGASGRTLLDPGLPATPAARRALSSLVVDLAAGRTARAGTLLGLYGVRYVVVRAGPGQEQLTEALTAQRDLVGLLSADAALFARPDPVPPGTVIGGSAPATPVELLAGSPVGALSGSADRPSGRVQGPATIALPSVFDARWTATLDGVRLRAVKVLGWAQGFAIPAGASGRVVVGHTGQRARDAELLIEAVLLLVVLATLARPTASAAPSPPSPGPRIAAGDGPAEVGEVLAFERAPTRLGQQ